MLKILLEENIPFSNKKGNVEVKLHKFLPDHAAKKV
jgi:hypothetical protein